MRNLLLLFIFLFTHLNSQEFSYPYPGLIEANIFTCGERFIKLQDGSYWQMKLMSGIIYVDKITGSSWERQDLVKLYKGTDLKFPYVLENLNHHEFICCKPFDPALCHRGISIISSPSVPIPSPSILTLFSIIHTGNHLFIQLNDGSYWQIKLIEHWFSQDFTTLSSWSRLDPVMLKLSHDEEFPYFLVNLLNGQEVFCKQVDPAFPSSIHWKYDDDEDDNDDDDDEDDIDDDEDDGDDED